jgi:uncharacterized membrane protein
MDRRIKVVLPIALAVIFVVIQSREIYPLMVVYFFPPLGKESVIPTAVALGFGPLHTALTFTTMDALTSLFIIWNFDLVCRLKVIGDIIARVMVKAINILSRRPWIWRFAYIGIFVVVFIPFQGSGAVTASVLGKLLGLKPEYLWVVIVLASFLSSITIAFSTRIAIHLL